MNPKAETVEELLARRKHLHMGMLKLAREDLSLTLQAALDAHAVKRPAPPLPPWKVKCLLMLLCCAQPPHGSSSTLAVVFYEISVLLLFFAVQTVTPLFRL